MSKFHIFIIRAILAVIFSVILMRLFYPDAHVAYGIALGGFLIGAAYFLEYWRLKSEKAKGVSKP